MGLSQQKRLIISPSVRCTRGSKVLPSIRKDIEIRDQFHDAGIPAFRAWGQGITAEKMKKSRWLKPTSVASIELAAARPGNRIRAR